MTSRRLHALVTHLATHSPVALAPGLEWVLDNHFVLRRATRQLRRGLTPAFEARLPLIDERSGLRRLELEAFAILREGEGLVDGELLARRVGEIGRERDASLAELWALPMVLRLGLLEQLVLDIPRLLEAKHTPSVDHRVAHCVRSLLMIEKTDWSRFVERVSEVERILQRDPSGDYPSMDFTTRDRYRRAVETLARGCKLSEAQVATRAIEFAAREPDRRPDAPEGPTGHVGYYLIDEGRRILELAIGHHPGLARRAKLMMRRGGGLAYLGTIAGLAALHLTLFALVAAAAGGPAWAVVLASLIAVIPAWTIGVSVANWLATLLVEPTPLPKLEFLDVIPAEQRTLIVVPGLLIRKADADALARRLEGHYLAARDPHVDIAMLTDFRDATTETLPDDQELLDYARAKIRALNRHYGRREDHGHQQPFHLFHRKRVWSANQDRWMGWERKRGKLEELNRLLRGDTSTSYVVHEGQAEHFAEFRHVLTLDADTILPLGSGRRLIETLAHPLNRARFDAGERVSAGYTVLQPRVDLAPIDAPTRFSRIFAGDGAFDIYSRAVSDVYQDLFGEGIFVGKGIYAIDDFQRSVAHRMPEDRVLSHDLLEGVHGRAGLVTDVVVYEDYPVNWLSYARRLHRWVRGDWQLLPWLGRVVPVGSGQRKPNRLGALARYKILDNLRRSLLSPSLVAFAIVAWLWLPGAALLWTGLVLALLATPLLIELSSSLLGSLRPGRFRSGIAGLVSSAPISTLRWLMRVSLLLHEAAVGLDAIARAITRTAITRRNQLEWTPAALAGRGTSEPRTIVRDMALTLVLPPVIAGLLALVRPSALVGALPLLLAWWVAPALAIWTARPRRRAPRAEAEIDRAPLRRLARRTWAYFETVVGPRDHWLPPDNMQAPPYEATAHRTSPTNIAMGLLATVAAHDLGYIDLLELVFRLRNTLETLARLPAYRGHVLNWVDTKTLEPLEPRYVSTVDSGNLAAALVILEQACRELALEARPLRARFVGLADSLDVLDESLTRWGERARPARAQVAALRGRVAAASDDPMTWAPSLAALDDQAFVELDARLLELFEAHASEPDPERFEELNGWATRIHAEVGGVRSELGAQLPWVALLAELPESVPEHQRAEFDRLCGELREVPRLGRTPAVLGGVLEGLASLLAGAQAGPPEWRHGLERLRDALETSRVAAHRIAERLEELAALARDRLAAMDFAFLYDRERALLYIGYDVSSERYDAHHYDLLASEARLTSLLAIAKGDAPLRHWAKLGRPIGRFGGARGLLSWSGTMFEYLLPPLLVDEGRDTLLDVSARAAIQAQIAWGRKLGQPWGVSESGYAKFDAHNHYQYRAFGVPSTGFRRGLELDRVVAPYASVIALAYAPVEVAANLDAIQAAGGCGPLGLFEAIDYTRERIGIGNDHEVVRSYMSHHQGMVMLALHGYLCPTTMPQRMHRNPALRSVDLLLHERSPGRVPVEQPQPAEQGPPLHARPASAQGWLADSSAAVDAHVFSNGRMGVLITRAGTGHSWWKDVAITRPCHDPTLQDIGSILYLHDEDHDHRWCSRVHAGAAPDASREVMFSPQGATITIHQHGLVAEFTTSIAPSEDAELRLVRLSDRSGRRRQLTITSYTELVLGNALEYERHPAFAKLFVDSQVLVRGERATLLFRRRPRGPNEPESWLACAMVSDRPAWSRFETDRERFLGRGRSLEDPAARMQALPSEDSPMAATLDTCAALSGQLELAAGGTWECAIVSVFGRSRAEVLERADRLATMAAVRRNLLDAERVAVARASERGQDTQVLRGHQRLLSALLYPRPELRECGQGLAATRLGQPALWRHGISGDSPILVVRMTVAGLGNLVRLVDAHSHWFERGVAIDLVILDDRESSYDASPRQRVAQLLEQSSARVGLPGGGVFVVDRAGLGDAERGLLLGCASVVLDADTDIARTLDRVGPPTLPSFEPEGQPRLPTPSLPRPSDLQFDNGYGGFSPDGREYVVHLDPGRQTPAPWVNVIANPQFGCVVSERGIGYAWSVNAGLRRLTPWSNDAVLDPPSTSIYLRDELDGEVWSPMPAPAPAPAAYQVRHGAGYSIFTHASHGLDQRVEVFVAPEDSVVIVELHLADSWERPRRLTVTLCMEWLLGSRRADARTLVTEFVPEHEVVLVGNSWNPTFADRCAFVRASEPLHGITTSREEFFGRGGDRRSPAGLRRIGLSGAIVPGADPCAALQVHVDLPAGSATTLHFVFGDGEDRAAALALAERYRERAQVEAARRGRDQVWERLLGCVQVESPDPGFDLQVNHWLLYQAIASRMWGRTGFNQSSGAFGFRDQLQDKMALVHAAPEQLRAHLLEAASQQFVEGDVLHWWHPPSGQGLRSRCSDDLLWLPFVTAHYVAATGDTTLLGESVRFLDGPRLSPAQHELYSNEFGSSRSATLYEHCMRALEHANTHGAHQLPLIGSCDWNDGFSHVGRAGRGESVWLGWFMRATESAFARVAERLGRLDDARELDERAAALLAPLAAAWDGAWYLRAFHDDGSAIGGAGAEACAIDSIAQSWAVISKGCESARAITAMQSVWDQLVDPDSNLVRLFTPPFRAAEARVGYVEGYPPGVRENGGQYTHAATWVAWAFAELGELERAWALARMLSPLAHGSSPEAIERYRVEPYVVAADIDSAPPHVGRGGWTWYTGAAAWSYRLAVEQLLGVRRVEGRIQLAPTLPREWPSCSLVLRDGDSVHRVRIEKRETGARVIGFRVDGVEAALPAIVPAPDGRDHELVVTLD